MEWLAQTARVMSLVRERGFQPGDRLPSERELAARFGMSRGAIREALIRLDTLRVIESHPKAGLYLRPHSDEQSVEAMVLFMNSGFPPSQTEIHQAEETRSILEMEAIRLACERRTQDDLDRMADILGDSAVAVRNRESLASLDAAFHKAIACATRNDVLVRFINVFYLLSRKSRKRFFEDPEQARRSHIQHVQIYAAILNQDTQSAQDLLDSHLNAAKERLAQLME
jgi:GntR family transcriptional regulator, transcriptional repressor for pyruvate dehydrogenase complex